MGGGVAQGYTTATLTAYFFIGMVLVAHGLLATEFRAALEHVVPGEVQFSVEFRHPDTKQATIFVYDGVPGGVNMPYQPFNS